MPCDCSGFAVEKTCFGKKYTGFSRTHGDTLPYGLMIEDGEKALCRAQQVIRNLLCVIHELESKNQMCHSSSLSSQLREEASEEIRLLELHEKSEMDKEKLKVEAEQKAKAFAIEQLQLEKTAIEDKLKKLGK